MFSTVLTKAYELRCYQTQGPGTTQLHNLLLLRLIDTSAAAGRLLLLLITSICLRHLNPCSFTHSSTVVIRC